MIIITASNVEVTFFFNMASTHVEMHELLKIFFMSYKSREELQLSVPQGTILKMQWNINW